MQASWVRRAVTAGVVGVLLSGAGPSGPANAIPSDVRPSEVATPPDSNAKPKVAGPKGPETKVPEAKGQEALNALPASTALSTIDPARTPFVPAAPVAPKVAAGQPNLTVDKAVNVVEGWSIGVSKSMGGCVAAATYKDQTTIWFGFSRKEDEGFIALTNPAWAPLQARKRYDLTLATEELGEWRGKFTAILHHGEKGVFVRNLHTRFVLDLTRIKVLAVQTRSTVVARLSFADIKPAMDALVDCQIAYLEGRDPVASGQKANSGTVSPGK